MLKYFCMYVRMSVSSCMSALLFSQMTGSTVNDAGVSGGLVSGWAHEVSIKAPSE